MKITAGDLVGAAEDRYHRQSLIEWWDQGKVSRARVLVVGAGALGNEVLKCLALMGVGQILVYDMDRIERSNLSRSHKQALASIDDSFGNSSDSGGHDGLSRQHRLQNSHWQPFPQGSQQKDIKCPH